MSFKRSWIGQALLGFALSAVFGGSALAGSMTVAWDPNTEGNIAGYLVSYGGSPGVYTHVVDVGNATVWTAADLTAGLPYYFAVQAYNTLGLVSDLSGEVAGTATNAFTDDVLTAGVSIRAVHISQLRARIDALRVRLGLAPFSWTDPALAAGGTTLRAQHVIDLRAALGEAYTKANRTPRGYTDPGLGAGSPVRVEHVAEMRAALLAIE